LPLPSSVLDGCDDGVGVAASEDTAANVSTETAAATASLSILVPPSLRVAIAVEHPPMREPGQWGELRG
jgi:hypothetical protein